MAVLRAACVLLFIFYKLASSQLYELTQVKIQALNPRGIRVYLADDPRITLFLFEGEIEGPNVTKNNSEIWGFGQMTKYGWMFEDRNVQLEVGQIVKYRVFVSTGHPFFGDKIEKKTGATNITLNGVSYIDNNGLETKIFRVKELEDPNAHGPHCPQTATKVLGGQACASQVLFEDDFDTFREDLWQVEHYIPLEHPEHPFVSYQRLTSNPTVYVKDGLLHIMPKLQQDLFKGTNESILTSTLDLTSGCTERVCSMQAVGIDILPPVVSGRVKSARFAFTYGNIYVRAKLPQGDWLYPEILLEPMSKKYGSLNYASGVLKIAMARGNTDVTTERFSNNQLLGGPYMNAKCLDALEFYHKKLNDGNWGDRFHEFHLQWTPDDLSLSVDGEQWGRYTPGSTGLRSWLPASCRGSWYELLKTGGKMAPFDTHFYITLGVAAGGTTMFPDDLVLGSGKTKPWRNRGRKSVLSFWNDMANWFPTWKKPGLIVDSIKVVAL